MDTASLIDRLAEVKDERPNDEREEMVTTTERPRRRGVVHPPIKHALCLNIPYSVFPNENRLTLGHLIRTESGKKYFKLAALLGDMCFQQSLEPEERAGSPGKHKRGRGRRNNNDGDEAEEEGRTTTTGCFWYEPGDGGEEFQYRNSDHIFDGVRSPSGNLLWIRFIILIYNPEFDPRKLINGIIEENKVGITRDANATSRRTASNQYDYPKDWRCYRDTASPESYGKLLENYLNVKGLSSACKDTIDSLSPEHVFDMRNEESLHNGISQIDRDNAHPSYMKLERYFGTSRRYTLGSDGVTTFTYGVDAVNPPKMIFIGAPKRVVRSPSLFRSSLSSFVEGEEEEEEGRARSRNSDEEQAISEAFERLKLCTNGSDTSSTINELIRIRDSSTSGSLSTRARSGGSLLSSYSYDEEDVETWDSVVGEDGEIDEAEITNKAIRRRAENHSEMQMIYETCEFGSPEFNEAISQYKKVACERLVADFASYKDETEQWENVYNLIFSWLDTAVSQPKTFWPTINRVFPNVSMFGNTMLRDVSMFIQGFRLEPGWKPAYLQELLLINLDVYRLDFGLHMNKLLSGEASAGKSICVEKLKECRVADTLIHATDMTEKAFVAGNASWWVNHKTIIFDEAPFG
jgi:hypothetical protein